MENGISIDGFLPPQVAARMEDTGVKKANLPFLQMFLLSVLAGAFIALGAIFCTTVITGGEGEAMRLPFGIVKLIGGLAFCLGLILVIVAGAELFTGNVLLIIAVTSRRVSLGRLGHNWAVLYVGNFLGATLTAYFMFLAAQYKAGDGAVGLTAMNIAEGKCSLPFVTALIRGVYCNALVCLAVWMCAAGRSITDKILAIIFPITAFVAAGFEHSVANMFFIPVALFIKSDAAFWASHGVNLATYVHLTWKNFFAANLIPVTIGNIIGGGGFVGVIYWIVYCRKNGKSA